MILFNLRCILRVPNSEVLPEGLRLNIESERVENERITRCSSPNGIIKVLLSLTLGLFDVGEITI